MGINLLNKRKKSMSIDEFKAWLNQLIVDKKGALPDLNDWKRIKENLDKVKPTTVKGGDIITASPIENISDQLHILSANIWIDNGKDI